MNQLGSFTPTIAKASSGIRDLLSKKNVFQWLPEHQKSFEETKEALCEPPILAMFDPTWQTVLETDASRKGLGFCLRQRPNKGIEAKKEDPANPWRLITSGSRFLTDAESRYAMIELEALGVYWAVRKCRVYLAGLDNFTVFVDHAPLKPWFNDYDLNSIENPRVQRYKMKLQEYRFKVEWRTGKNPGPHAIPDALSRAPTTDPSEEDIDEDSQNTAFVRAIITNKQVSCPDMAVEAIAKEAKEDDNYQRLINEIQGRSASTRGENHSTICPSYRAQFNKVFGELSVLDGVILKGSQMVIPNNVKKQYLKRLHDGHLGEKKTLQRARQVCWWPGISADIKNMIKECMECQQLRPTPVKEPLIQDRVPSRPFEMATTDFFQTGRSHYLIYADRLSGFPFVAEFSRAPASSGLIRVLRRLFAMTGVPNVLRSDQGPQYSSEMTQNWLKAWNVKWVPSSPHNPRSNGHSESIVKAVKHLLKKTGGKIDSDEFQAGMLELRNSPRDDGLSPAERVYGHPIRSRLPAHWTAFRPEWRTTAEEADTRRLRNAASQKFYYDRSSANRKQLGVGAEVLVQDPQSQKWDRTATIIERDFRRYRLLFPSGRYAWRNIRFLRELQRAADTDAASQQAGDYDAASQQAGDCDNNASASVQRGVERGQNSQNSCEDDKCYNRDYQPRPKRSCRRPKHLDDYV